MAPVCLTNEHDLDRLEIVTMRKVFGALRKFTIYFFSEVVITI